MKMIRPPDEHVLHREKKVNIPGNWGFIIPDNFILIQDTREQNPLFDGSIPITIIGHNLLHVKEKALKNGDYSIEGYEDLFCIERKQVSDFFSYIGSERTKTTAKMERFREMQEKGGWVGLVIEATEQDLLNGYFRSKLEPNHVRGSLVSFEIRTGIHIYYSRDRSSILRYILDRAIKFFNIKQEKSHE